MADSDQVAGALAAWRTVVEFENSFDTKRTPVSSAVPRLLGALEAVVALHREFKIYDECGHHHTDEDVASGTAIDGGDFLSCLDGYMYSVCRECCAGGSAAPAGSYGSPYQSEECASDHDHSECWPCSTAAVISAALLGGQDAV